MSAIRSAIQPIGRRRSTQWRLGRLAATKRLAIGTAIAGLALLVLATQVSGQPVTTGGVGSQTGPTYPEIAQLPNDAVQSIEAPASTDARRGARSDIGTMAPHDGREPAQTR